VLRFSFALLLLSSTAPYAQQWQRADYAPQAYQEAPPARGRGLFGAMFQNQQPQEYRQQGQVYYAPAQPNGHYVPRNYSYFPDEAAPAARPSSHSSVSPSPSGGFQARFEPQMVSYNGPHSAGTIVIDTSSKYLFLVTGDGQAKRYGVGVGREGFQWRGVKNVTRKAEWPDWRPPPEMRKRRPDLPTFMAGGISNPLGARALYLGSSMYRIHGTNEPHTIGHNVSSGCFRMRNEDVEDLYSRVRVGTRVVVS
jgi:lipoprotein-anchoring transpeptidase ErfK/SrfK